MCRKRGIRCKTMECIWGLLSIYFEHRNETVDVRNGRSGWWGHPCFSEGETQGPVAAWLRKMVLKVDGRLSAQAMDKLQGLSRLGSANLVRPRRCLNGPSNSASRHRQGDRRDKPLHPSQIAGGGPFTFLKEEKQRAWKDHLYCSPSPPGKRARIG